MPRGVDRWDVREFARREHIRDDAYSLEGGMPSDRYVLERTADGWSVYFSEYGRRRGERFFASEDEACCHLFELLVDDPTTRRGFGR
jgi:hypothetical protein